MAQNGKYRQRLTYWCDECGEKCFVGKAAQWKRSHSGCKKCGCHRMMEKFTETTWYARNILAEAKSIPSIKS